MFKKILVGTDFSEASDEARRVAIEVARRLGAELEIVHVEEPLPAYAFSEGALPDLPRLQEEVRIWAERQLEDLARGARASGVSTTTTVLLGVPASAIVEAARTARRSDRGGNSRTDRARARAPRLGRRACRPQRPVRGPDGQADARRNAGHEAEGRRLSLSAPGAGRART